MFFRKRLITEKHLQLTIECHLVFDRPKIIDAPTVSTDLCARYMENPKTPIDSL